MRTLNISRRVGLIEMFKDFEYKNGVEVGTDRGQYARDICSRMPFVKLYTIDPYFPFIEGDEVKDEQEMEKRYQHALKLLEPYPNCELVRTTSMIAVKSFEDNSLDFVFIDGNHLYEFVKEDIEEWSKKVRKGGIVAGHDYVESKERRYGIVQAVNEYAEKNGIEITLLKKGGFVTCWLFIKQ